MDNLIVWKHEGRKGPTTHYGPDAEKPTVDQHGVALFPSRPWGTTPKGVTDLGYMTKTAAKNKAKELKADFIEV